MRKYLSILGFGFVAALAGSSVASAADLAGYVPPPPPEFSWAGPYVGINGGYAGDRFEYPFSDTCCKYDPIYGQADLTSSGFVGGAQIGYNMVVSPHMLVGLEADIQASGIKGNVAIDVGSFHADAGSQVDWFGTIRGRLGWINDKLLLYVTGGAAYGKTTSSYNIDFGYGGPSGSISNANWGWTAGAGAEYAFNKNWSLKTEYLYVDLGKTNLATWSRHDEPCGTLDVNTHFHVVRAGLNYHF